MDNVSESLANLSKLREDRALKYGDAEFKKGKVMQALLGEIHLNTEMEFAKYGMLDMIVSKLIRYANNFNEGGHDDSLDDLSVYSQMLKNIHAKEKGRW